MPKRVTDVWFKNLNTSHNGQIGMEEIVKFNNDIVKNVLGDGES